MGRMKRLGSVTASTKAVLLPLHPRVKAYESEMLAEGGDFSPQRAQQNEFRIRGVCRSIENTPP